MIAVTPGSRDLNELAVQSGRIVLVERPLRRLVTLYIEFRPLLNAPTTGNEPSMTTSTETDKRPRKWTKLWIALGILVVVILLLPTICSYVIVPGIIQSEISESVEGKVSVSGTSFSWFGSQEI